jgi:hypothetical protein
MIVAVVDGMGGRIGAEIVAELREAFGESVDIWALGTNGIATQKMLRAGAQQGATGENAITVSIGRVDYVIAPIGVVIPHAMMGEISPAIATAVASAAGRKLLIPVNQPYFEIIGVKADALAGHIRTAVEILRDLIQNGA